MFRQRLCTSDPVECEGARLFLQPAESLAVPGVVVEYQRVRFKDPFGEGPPVLGISDFDGAMGLPRFENLHENLPVQLDVQAGEDGPARQIGGVEKIRIVILQQIIDRIANAVFQRGGKNIFGYPGADDRGEHLVLIQQRGGDEIPVMTFQIVAVPCPVEGEGTLKFKLQRFHVPQDGFSRAVDFQLFLHGDAAELPDQGFRVRIAVLLEHCRDPGKAMQLSFL